MNPKALKAAYDDIKKRSIEDAQFLRGYNATLWFVWKTAIKVDPERFIQTKTYIVNDQNLTQKVPLISEGDAYNFGNINSDECGFFLLNGDTYDDIPLAPTSFGSLCVGYYIAGNNFKFTPDHPAEQEYLLRYIWKFAKELDANSETDVSWLEDIDEDLFLHGLDVWTAIEKQNFDITGAEENNELSARARFEAEMAEFMKNYNQDEIMAEFTDLSNFY